MHRVSATSPELSVGSFMAGSCLPAMAHQVPDTAGRLGAFPVIHACGRAPTQRGMWPHMVVKVDP